ncbi:DUF485 domain-containing protein [Paraburkholderia sp. J7]|uniref:DUF485 domain-containing protein n=1 Tax=Paraburkholderia sp. J7 TaxID=2805438 RepID=UPI002AB724D4|nr:DUF485 domain-containing protein [Paraburkholderia sp. J7]
MNTNAAACPNGAQSANLQAGRGTAPPILGNARFHQLVRSRRRFSWTLAACMLVAYFAFILLIAFAPSLLATPIVAGHPTTWGIPIGLGMLAYTFALVAIYVRRANTVFDGLLDSIRREGQS